MRRVLWVAIVTTSLAMWGQNQPGQQAQQAPPSQPATGTNTQVYQTPVYVPVTPQVVGGYYTGYAGGGYYGLTTPTARFDSPQPTAGISLADRTGISSNTPVATGVLSTLPPTTLVYTNVEPSVAPAGTEEVAAPVATGPAITGPRLAYDLGPSYYGGESPIGVAPPAKAAVSLGEVAAHYKTPVPPNIRRYTNADVERMNANMRLGGVNINARLAAEPVVPPTETAQAQPPRKAPTTSAATTQPTTPEIAQPQPGAQPPVKELPATSSFLPLLGIFGLGGAGIGLLIRRYRTR